MEIRRYKHSDYNALIKLLGKVYGSKIDQETLEKHYVNSKCDILVAVESDSDSLVGCSFIEIKEDYVRPERIIYVTYVAVDEKFRHKGIGKMLIDKVEQMCCELECSAIELTSANYRTGAHAFYDRLGFTKKKTTVFIKDVLPVLPHSN